MGNTITITGEFNSYTAKVRGIGAKGKQSKIIKIPNSEVGDVVQVFFRKVSEKKADVKTEKEKGDDENERNNTVV